MEAFTIIIDKPSLEKIHSLGIGYTIKNVDVTDIDYSSDTLWTKLKGESIRAYKKLKEREFNLRTNNIRK